MAQTKKLLTIDINEDIYDIITGKQGDTNSRFLDVKLIDRGLSLNLIQHAVRFSAVKPDGRRVYDNCVITDATNGRFQVELTNQLLAIPGKITAEFTVYGANETQSLTTKTFEIIVLESLFDEDAIASTNEFGAAVILFQDVAAVRETIQRMNDLLNMNLDVKVSTRATQASVNDLKTEVLKISGAARTVKQIQRGTFVFQSRPINIGINPVSPDRCSVRLYGTAGGGQSDRGLNCDAYVVSLSEAILTVDVSLPFYNGTSNAIFGYEIVEYY